MQSVWNKYVLVESSISGAINACISIGFVVAVFHGRAIVMPLGSGGFVRDAVPQTLAVALMGSLVPLLLTRKRRGKGDLPREVTMRSGALASPFATAILIALAMLLIGAGLQALLLPQVFAKGLDFRQLLVFKACYGAALGAFVTALALRLTWRPGGGQ
jgi:hypothetical protein